MRNKVIIVVYIATVIVTTVWVRNFYKTVDHETIQVIQLEIPKVQNITIASLKNVPKCDLSEDCPRGHFAVRVKGGAANAVGPTICFDGHVIMSHGLRNLKPGLSIVHVNGNNGTIERFDSFHQYCGRDNLTYMMEMKPGVIVLVASFDDVSTMMSEEAKDIFVGLGSTLVKRIKYRDSWVFAGRSGMSTSPFEELTANDEKTNVYGGWPELSEVAGCFPRKL